VHDNLAPMLSLARSLGPGWASEWLLRVQELGLVPGDRGPGRVTYGGRGFDQLEATFVGNRVARLQADLFCCWPGDDSGIDIDEIVAQQRAAFNQAVADLQRTSGRPQFLGDADDPRYPAEAEGGYVAWWDTEHHILSVEEFDYQGEDGPLVVVVALTPSYSPS